MKKYKIVRRTEINKHIHIVNKYDAYIAFLDTMIQDENCNEEKLQKYNELIDDLMFKRDEYINKILGVSSIERAYMMSGNKKLLELGEVMNEVLNFFENNTSFSLDTIKRRIEHNLVDVSIVEKFPDNPTGQGYYDSTFGEMAIREDKIKSDDIKFLIRHELTHVLGNQMVNGVKVSGYSKAYGGDSISLIHVNKKEKFLNSLHRVFAGNISKESKYVQFNEACVEMFALKDVPLQSKSMFNYWCINKNLYTNFREGCYYIFNSNFVREIMIASGVNESELFDGLFDYKSSKKVIKKIGGRTFRKIAGNMDKLYGELKEYNNVLDEIFDKYYKEDMADVIKSVFECCTAEEIEKIDDVRKKAEKRMSLIEKMIIDKLLIKRLKKLDGEEKKSLLEEFSKFVVFERDYFEKVSGFKVSIDDGNDTHRWIEKYRVDSCKKIDGEEIKDSDKENVVKQENREDI